MGVIGFLVLCVCFWISRGVSGDATRLGMFPSLPVAVRKSDNSVCREESDLYEDMLKNFTLWAHESKSQMRNEVFAVKKLLLFLRLCIHPPVRLHIL